MSRKNIKLVLIGLVLFTFSCASMDIGSSSFFGDLVEAVGAIASGQPERLQKIALDRMKREVGYEALRVILRNANVGGADYFVKSLKAYVEENNGGKAVGAFLKGLELSGVEDVRAVMELYYAAAVTIRLTSTEVAKEVQEYIDYMSIELSSYRGVAEMEAEGPPEKFSSPEKTWNTFMAGLQKGDWEPVARALVGYIPESVDLSVVEEREEVQTLKKDIARDKKLFTRVKYNIGKTEEIVAGLKALEVRATTPKGSENFWVVFEEHKNAWKLVGVIKDISLLKAVK